MKMIGCFGAALILSTGAAVADPCGMVPPIYQGQGSPISRVGEQITYVFHNNGVETFVIRPGFTGKVDEFGMLIPFPNPPALRKVPDHVFQHVAAAIDPPEVTVDLRQWRGLKRSKFKSNNKNGDSLGLNIASAKESVRVIKKEAVGMYEVVVLEAGSAAALKKWMDEHGFKFPQGMDKVCNEYIAESWCFVAVKTKVGRKDGVDARPAQRSVNSKLSAGSSFDGHVQGMGFRFKSEKLVVPMRLSAFNDGELRNIVYLATDGPKKIRSIPEEYVVRQVSGKQLFKNLTDPLPLRIVGGSEADLRNRLKTKGHFNIHLAQQGRGAPINWSLPPVERLKQARDPRPHNGAAKQLFASDLLASTGGELSLPHEEQEKELLRIGERFGLRGPLIDKENASVLEQEAEKTVKAAMANLTQLSLTIVDGDFPREVLGSRNLTFAAYNMPSRRNKPSLYDANLKGPAPKKEGVLKLGALEIETERQTAAA
ncbi:MAG: DUF2330 domain-containing protein, partial [Planctomycetales bacterium]